MLSSKLSLVVITIIFIFVALMSMQLITTSYVEGVAHTNENHRKLTKSHFLVSNSMEGGPRRKLLQDCPFGVCMGGLSCCPILPGPLLKVCITLPPGVNICEGCSTGCLACDNNCSVGQFCCGIHGPPVESLCVGLAGNINNCGACNNKCPVGELCCSGKCVNTLTNSANCGSCGHVCNNVPCTLGICGGYGD